MNTLARVKHAANTKDHRTTAAAVTETTATTQAANEHASAGAPAVQDAVALQSLLEKHFSEPGDTIAASSKPAARPAPQTFGGQWKSRSLKTLLGVALVAIAGWMPAQRLFEVSSTEAVVNARLVTVRAPINGIVQLDSPNLSVGEAIDVGTPLVTVKNPRVDTGPANAALQQLRDAEEERQALSARLDSTKAIRDALRSQLAVFRDNRIRQVEAKLAEADARIASATAEQQRAEAIRFRREELTNKGTLAAAAMDDADRDVLVTRARVDEAGAGRQVLAVELTALKDGTYLGDDYNDQPRSAQRIDELDQSIAAIEADIARLGERIGRGQSALHDEERRQALASEAHLTSPVGGQVWEVLTAPGEQVVAGQELFSLLNCTDAIVTATVSEAIYNSLSVGMHATFTYREGGPAMAGKVVQLSGVASASSNFAITPSALTKESYRVAVAVDDLQRSGSCAVGRTGRIVFQPVN